MKRSKHEENIEDFPKLYEENSQLVGYISECKYAYQCGYTKCLCTKDDMDNKYCFYGWYTAGLIPDGLCIGFEPNRYWTNVSIDYFMNRHSCITKLIEDSQNINDITHDTTQISKIGEYMFKPCIIFIAGCPSETTEKELEQNIPWISTGIKKVIYKVPFITDETILNLELNNLVTHTNNIGMTPIFVVPWNDDFTDYANLISSELTTHEMNRSLNLVTRLVHGAKIQQNNIMNIANINTDIWAYNTKNLFEDKTIICVAGGPSLNDQIEFLKENQNKVVIIAVSTIAKTLIDNGITPDIIATMDMKSDNICYLEGISEEDMNKSYLLYEFDCGHEVVDFYKGPRIFLIADPHQSPMTTQLHKYIGLDIEEVIHKSGTVSNMIYQYAQYLNPKQILLVGYDLCYQVNGATHAEGTDLNAKVKLVKTNTGLYLQYYDVNSKLAGMLNEGTVTDQGVRTQLEEAFEVENNSGNMVATNKMFKSYLYDLNNKYREGNIETFDLSPIGAKKEIPYKYYSDVVIDMEYIDSFNIIGCKYEKMLRTTIVKNMIKNCTDNQLFQQNHYAHFTLLYNHYNMNPNLDHDNIKVKLLTKLKHKVKENITPYINKSLEKLKNGKN